MSDNTRAMHGIAELIVGWLFAALISVYGWLTLINEGVTLTSGKYGRISTAELTGSGSLWFTLCVFAVAATVAVFAARRGGYSWRWCVICGLVVLGQPFAWLAGR